ncbi:hypothetical protein D3C85_668620 [compost metagenome]
MLANFPKSLNNHFIVSVWLSFIEFTGFRTYKIRCASETYFLVISEYLITEESSSVFSFEPNNPGVSIISQLSSNPSGR